MLVSLGETKPEHHEKTFLRLLDSWFLGKQACYFFDVFKVKKEFRFNGL